MSDRERGERESEREDGQKEAERDRPTDRSDRAVERKREGERNNTVLLLRQSIFEPTGGAWDCLVTCAQPSSSHYLWKFFGVCVYLDAHTCPHMLVDRKKLIHSDGTFLPKENFLTYVFVPYHTAVYN